MIRVNEAVWDRTLRVMIGGMLVIGALGTVIYVPMAVVGVAIMVSGLRGWCPIYAALGVSTLHRPRAGAGKR